MSETTTRTCDGCGTNLSGTYASHWVLSYEGFGATRLCEDTSDKHLCMDCARPALSGRPVAAVVCDHPAHGGGR